MKKSRILVYILLFLFLCSIAFKANRTSDFIQKYFKNLSTNTSMNIEDIASVNEIPKDIETAKTSITIKSNEVSSFDEMTKQAKKKLPKEVFATYTTTTKDGNVTKKIFKVKKLNKYYLVTEDNQKLTTPVYDDFAIFDAKKGIFVSIRNHKEGLVNYKGRMLVPTKYETIEKTQNEDLVVVKNHKYAGLYDIKLAKLVLPAIFTQFEPFDQYNWKILSNKKYGFINYKNGRTNFTKPKYQAIEKYKIIFKTSIGNKYGLIDAKNGDIISEPTYDEIVLINEQNCKKDHILIFKTRIDNRYGVIYYTLKDSTLISPIYEDVQYKGLVNVLSNGYWRILDNKGNVVSRTQGAFK